MSLPRHDNHNQWFDIYPVRERLDDKSHIFIDLGGGAGHDVASLKSRFPDLPGRLALQDLPAVVNNIHERALLRQSRVMHPLVSFSFVLAPVFLPASRLLPQSRM